MYILCQYDLYQLVLSPECPTSVPINSSCSNTSIVLNKGDNIQWSCQLDAIPGTSLSLLPSNVEQSISETIEKECGKEASVSYDVVETRRHECYNMYTVRVMVCAADDSVVGEFDVGMHGSAAEGTRVVVKLNPEPQGVSGTLYIYTNTTKHVYTCTF